MGAEECLLDGMSNGLPQERPVQEQWSLRSLLGHGLKEFSKVEPSVRPRLLKARPQLSSRSRSR